MQPPKRKMKLIEMKINKICALAVLLAAVMLLAPSVSSAANEAEVRGAVQQVFQQLKSRDYNGLYEWLPASSRSRMSRDVSPTLSARAGHVCVDRSTLARCACQKTWPW